MYPPPVRRSDRLEAALLALPVALTLVACDAGKQPASTPTRKRRRSIKTITKWEQTAGSVNQTINFYGDCVREFRR